LKVAGIRQLLLGKKPTNAKSGGEKRFGFLLLIYFRGYLDSPCFIFFRHSGDAVIHLIAWT
ncbi:hypothetical protein ACFSCZ_13285, partial [Siminovitchia sediminis]